ncbi:MAG: hypothetical protein IPJ77_00065 [Planctomycetes bacterium]|nr:hypothetical protein [Planctomycetota bacterium]
MSVITTEGGGSAGTAVVPGAQADTSAFAADCDYNLDAQHSHVYDPSMETLQTVNQILCMISQTGYANLVNEGDYKALIDEAKCSDGSDSGSASSDEGQSSGANSGAPTVWTIHSERASNSSDQIVEFWVPQNDNGQSSTIFVRMLVTAGATDTNPFGSFTLNFVGIPEGGTIEDARMHGTLATLDVLDGFIGFSFYEESGDISVPQDPGQWSGITQANVNMFSDQTQGVAYIRRQERSNFGMGGDSGIQETTYRIAFDPTNVLRGKDADPPTCLSRTDFDTRVWRYSLYDATTGDRIELNSGFGFQTEGGDYGWMGYYGMWTAPGVTVASGDTVTRKVFGETTPTTYTVVKAPGKLIKNTKQTLDLAELESEEFNWWDFGVPGGIPSGPPTQYKVEYHAGAFQKIAQWDEQEHEFVDLKSPVTIETDPLNDGYGYLGMYSESLGGPVSYVHGATTITYWSQEFVNGASDLFTGGTPATLYGYFDCLRAGILGSEASSGDVYSTPSFDVGTPYEFEFDATTLTLTDSGSGDPIGLATGETYSGGPFGWGMRTGPLVTSTTGFSNPNDIWSADVFYTWETGPNSWNGYATLLDDTSTAVSFDPPLQFRYTHETANDRNADATYNGRNYVLSYNGPGELFVIPNAGVDLDDNGSPDRFYPLFSLVDGTLMGPDGTEYVVKALEMEQTLDIAIGACGALNIDTVGDLPLPDGTEFVAPEVGVIPTVEDAPRVIEGEVVETVDG